MEDFVNEIKVPKGDPASKNRKRAGFRRELHTQGVPADGQAEVFNEDTGKLEWSGLTGSGAPNDVNYLVGTSNATLTNEIVVGTTPGGELGGTWASPTVDTTHSGSTHSAATDTHIADTTDAHDASAISILDAAGDFTATDVEGALAELQADNEASHHDAVTASGAHTMSGQDITAVAASDSLAAHVELATTAETTAGTDTGRAITPAGLQASERNIKLVDFRLVEQSTDVTADTDLFGDWVCPWDCTIIQDDANPYFFCAWTDTAGTTGTMVVDVHLNGTTIMTTNKLDIETGEKSTGTAATQPDLTTTDVSAGDIFTFDVDDIHTTAAKGLVVRLALRPD